MSSVIPLSCPDITDSEIEAVVAALRCERLSIGPRQARFEEMVAERAGRRHGVAINSGTSGLHLLMLALGVGPGDEVITTPFSFVATANCALYVGATPVFVDIDPLSLNLDPQKVEAAITPKTKAIVAVEVFGNPTHMDELEKIANRHEIALIEDCCEALGGVYHKRPVGSFGRAGVFAFYPNKQITTGEGGLIVTDDQNLADLCKSLRNQGRPIEKDGKDALTGNRAGSWLAHERLGYNYRMSEVNAALGIAQMERLDTLLARRRAVAGMYMRRLMDFNDLVLPTIEEPENASWFVFVLRLSDQFSAIERDRIITGLRRHDIGCANYFPCIHLQPYIQQMLNTHKGMCPIAESVSNRTIALPFYNQLEEAQVELICHTLKIMLDRERLLKRD